MLEVVCNLGFDHGSLVDHFVVMLHGNHLIFFRYEEGATVQVRTTLAGPRAFDQEFEIRSARDGRAIATFTHHWVWMDTSSGRPVEMDDDTCRRLLEGGR